MSVDQPAQAGHETDVYALPEELEAFRKFLVNTGGNRAEELLERLDKERDLSLTNLPVFIMAVAVQSQIALLRRLNVAGRLIGDSVHDVSDGHHTMGELYDHRRALTRALALALGFDAWRSRRHHPEGDPMFEGYFIVGLELPQSGTVTYHYKLEHWDEFEDVPELEHAPRWDGHTPADTVDRLLATRML